MAATEELGSGINLWLAQKQPDNGAPESAVAQEFIVRDRTIMVRLWGQMWVMKLRLPTRLMLPHRRVGMIA